ncbi:MAG TPA: DUF6683 family protein [Ideonella sp.]|nr:DUF6683 family protein [Ideonella sp.]
MAVIPRLHRSLLAGALLAACAAAQAFDFAPPPPPMFQGLIVPLHPQGTMATAPGSGRSPPTARATTGARAPATLAPAGNQLGDNARQLATAFPAAQRSQMTDAYLQSFETYRKLEHKLGVPSNDVAGAMAAYIAGNYMALHNVEVPDAHFQRLVAQMREALGGQDSFVSASARQKRQMYEQLAMVGTFMAVARQAFLQNPNPASEQNFRNAARANLEAALKQPADGLRLGAQGLSLR